MHVPFVRHRPLAHRSFTLGTSRPKTPCDYRTYIPSSTKLLVETAHAVPSLLAASILVPDPRPRISPPSSHSSFFLFNAAPIVSIKHQTTNMASTVPVPDQAAILKDLLDAVRSLQLNQVELSSAVDAISGRVNVLAGMKEVRDAAIDSSPTPPVKKAVPEPIQSEDARHDDVVVPQSPSLPASQLGSSPSAPSPLSHVRKQSVTSKIILTWVSCSVPV